VRSTEDFDPITPLDQGGFLSLFEHIGWDFGEKDEKRTVGIKDRKNACAKNWDPYNAPPSTRRM